MGADTLAPGYQAHIDEMQAHLKAARDIAAAADKDQREFTDEESVQLKELLGKAEAAKKAAEKAKGTAAIKAAISEFGDSVGLNDKSGDKITPAGLIVPGQKSLGQAYVESAEFKGLLASVPSGVFSKQQRVNARPTGFKSLLTPKGRVSGRKALVTGASDTSGGAFVRSDDLGLQVGLAQFQRPLTLRDLVTNGTTGSDSLEFVRVTGVTNNAAPVAEATTAALPTQVTTSVLQNPTGGGYKPESALAVQRLSTNVKTIAHWIPITKRAISDAGEMLTLIDNFLEYGLEEELEDQMIAGDGTGENFEGLANVSGVQAQAWDTNALTTLRKAKTKVRTGGRAIPNGYLMNPADVETLDLLTDNENRYYFGGPGSQGLPGTQPLWNLPVVESEAVPAGTAYCGDFTKAILWDREQSTITTTDSHGDFFVRNLVAILAEMRAAFAVIQPNAFVEIDLTEA